MVRVIAPTTALLIIGVVCCNNSCGNSAEMECGDFNSGTIDENSNIVSGSNNSSGNGNNGDSNVPDSANENNRNSYRPPSPAPSITESIKQTATGETFLNEVDDDYMSSSSRTRSSSAEYDGDCEKTPTHIYCAIMERIPKQLSGISNLLSDRLINIGDDDELDKYSDYLNEDDDTGIDADADTPDNLDDEGISSSHDSLVKTHGGSKSSNCNTLNQASARRIKPVNNKKAPNHPLVLTDEKNKSADSNENQNNSEPENSLSYSQLSQSSKFRSESPFTRSSRVNSIENEMATTENSIETQILKEIYPKVASGPFCEILDGIDRLASEKLQKLSKQVGTFIFEQLWHQITQINPDKPISVSEAYEFFDLLSKIYSHIISDPRISGNRLELCELIEECLKATLSVNYNKFKPVRDAMILFMLNCPNDFDDKFFDTVEMYETLKSIVCLSNENEHFDTIEYVRVMLNFFNLLDIQSYFKIDPLTKPERKPSDELFLPLMEDNLMAKSLSSHESENIKIKKVKKTKKKKKETTVVVKKNDMNSIVAVLNELIWENRLVLTLAFILAAIIQCLFIKK